jgi:hypothetical protein
LPEVIMAILRCAAVVTAAAALSFPAFGQSSRPTDAAEVLAAARAALGGEKTLAAVRTFVATGRTRQVRGDNLVPIEFEITCQLPERCVRKDEIPAQGADLTVMGFSGDTLIQFPSVSGGPSGPGGARLTPVTTVKQDFTRLLLGMFAGSTQIVPLTFTYAALGEAPEGQADILAVAGPEDFTAQLVVQRETRLPVMLMWHASPVAPGGRGTRPPPSAAAPPVEHRLYFGDFREVSGLKWPFRVRRAIGNDTVEETTFDRVRVNVKIDERRFEVPR